MTPSVQDVSRGLYDQTLHVVRLIWPVVFWAALVSFASGLFGILLLDVLVLIMAGTAVIYTACGCMLSDGRVQGVAMLRHANPRDLEIFAILYGLPVILMAVLDAVSSYFSGDGSVAVTVLTLAASVGFLLLQAQYGTILPAIMDKGDVSLRAASQRVRARTVFWHMVTVLLFLLLVFIALAITVGLLIMIFYLVGIPAIAPVATFLSMMVANIIAMGMLVSFVVILCNAYHGAYCEPGISS